MSFEGNIGHLEGIESPWANAGGVVWSLEEVERMAHTRVGSIEAGPYTLEKYQPDGYSNGKRVYYHDLETGETFSSLKPPNKGLLDEVEKEIPEMLRIAHAHHKPLVVNVIPVSDEPVKESEELVKRAYQAGADAVLLNAGYPNVVIEDGGRHELLSRNAIELGRVLVNLADLGLPKPIFVSISPQESTKAADQVYKAVKDSGIVSAVFAPTAWPVASPKDENGEFIIQGVEGMCGKSGPAMAKEAALQTAWAVSLLQRSGIDVVSPSSIMTGKTLRMRLGSGAVAGTGTTFYYESQNGWQEDTDKLLWDLDNRPLL